MQPRRTRVTLVGHRPLVLPIGHQIPIDAGIVGGDGAQLIKDIPRRVIFKTGDAHPISQCTDDPPVGFGLPLGCHCPAHPLDAPLRIGKGAISLAPRGGGQNNMGQFCRFGEENIHHHQMFQAAQGMFAVGAVGIGNHRVFAIDQHGKDTFTGQIKRSYLGNALFPIHHAAVKSAEVGLHSRVSQGLIAGVGIGGGTPITGPLDVILPAHGVDAAPLNAQVTGHQRQVAETLHIVNAADVFGNAQGVEDRSLVGGTIPDCRRFNIFSRDTSDDLSPLRRKEPHVFQKFSATGSPGCHKFLVNQPFARDHMGHTQQQRHIRANA